MPRTIFPPTPAPSMDIVGKDGGPHLSSKDKISFVLPPPAIAPSTGRDAQSDDGRLQTQAEPEYSLPPPPTRTRKIIQMTPKMDAKGEVADSHNATVPAKACHAALPGSSAIRKATGKKQPSSTSQAGKKIARKTAHSVIERRRRSKMNEEFGVLKNMIPACKDQDMHKLAILQASIEYLRYLEKCIADLKTANGLKSRMAARRSPPVFPQSALSPNQLHVETDEEEEDDDDNDEDSDVDMTGQTNPNESDTVDTSRSRTTETRPERPTLEPLPLQSDGQKQTTAHSSPYSMTTSPVLGTPYPRSMSHILSLSGLPSPAIGARTWNNHRYQQSTSSASTSPTLVPTSSKEADEEATAALLMLNKDRRNTNTSSSSSSGRGMSVKDLLSS